MTTKPKMNNTIAAVCLGFGVLTLSSPALQAYQDVTPAEAYAMAATDANTYILDVRTEAEWRWVGHPGANKLGEGAALDGKVVNISYKIFKKKSFINNPSFLSEVGEIFDSNPNVVLINMCRSGKRSVAASEALEDAGYTNVYNMVTGFEGGKDAAGYRTVNGWKMDGMPYSYSGAGYQD